jgi:hypothetical protein
VGPARQRSSDPVQARAIAVSFVPRGTGHRTRRGPPRRTRAWSVARQPRRAGDSGWPGLAGRPAAARPARPTCRRPIRREATAAELPWGGVVGFGGLGARDGTEPRALSATAGSPRVVRSAPRPGAARWSGRGSYAPRGSRLEVGPGVPPPAGPARVDACLPVAALVGPDHLLLEVSTLQCLLLFVSPPAPLLVGCVI